MGVMKDMKLYHETERIHRELAAVGIGPGSPLKVANLTPFDQYHYHGTSAVDEAIAIAKIRDGMRVLDVGAGLGGPARYIAERTGAHVTALELQGDLNATGAELTRRCGLSHLVDHRCANVLDGVDGSYDAIISMLCFLHIPERDNLFKVCRAALKSGGTLYIEDYGRRRNATPREAEDLARKVQCPYLPTTDEYHLHLKGAGFAVPAMSDMTKNWTAFTSSRLMAYRSDRPRHVALHGAELVDGLDDFYATVAGLFGNGLIAGLKITAR
jgi:cyclopropane fatty-acyl-phospholipid synthase-like methyltransferase